MQVTSDKFVKIYSISKETLIPELDHIMNNFIDCTHMLFGSWSKYCITYKVGQTGFYVHRRKYDHMFYSEIHKYAESDRRGCALNSVNQFIVAFDLKIEFYC